MADGAYTYLDAKVLESFSSSALGPVNNPAYPGVPIGAFGPRLLSTRNPLIGIPDAYIPVYPLGLITLLADHGIINNLLLTLGVLQHPLPLLYNEGAVLLGLVYTYLPFMVLPLYASLERLDRVMHRDMDHGQVQYC